MTTRDKAATGSDNSSSSDGIAGEQADVPCAVCVLTPPPDSSSSSSSGAARQ